MLHKIWKKRLTFSTSCFLLLASFFPQAVNAGQVVQFALEGVLESIEEIKKIRPYGLAPVFNGIDFSGATLSGFINIDLSEAGITSAAGQYSSDNYHIQITANNGQAIHFTPPESKYRSKVSIFSKEDIIEFKFTESQEYSDLYQGSSFYKPNIYFNINLPFDLIKYPKIDNILDDNLRFSSNDLGVGYLRLPPIYRPSIDKDYYFNTGYFTSLSISVSPVPEAPAIALFGLGVLIVFGLAKRQQKNKNGGIGVLATAIPLSRNKKS